MNKEELLASLHPLERRVLPAIHEKTSVEHIQKATALQEVEVLRALDWLEKKGLVKITTTTKDIISLDVNGKRYLTEKLPEQRCLEVLEHPLSLQEIENKAALNKDELSISLGILKKKEAIILDQKVSITDKGKRLLTTAWPEEEFLKVLPKEAQQLTPHQRSIYEELKRRRNIIKTETKKIRTADITPLGREIAQEAKKGSFIERVTPSLLKEGTWKGKQFRQYDLQAKAPTLYPGKRHYVAQAVEYARRIWLDMGFKEMSGPMTTTSFWNFDALFTPQDHPARELQDTFFLEDPEYGRLQDKKLVAAVKAMHERGYPARSKGWQYEWKEEEARKNVLRTHTTPLSARTLATLKASDLPTKYFAISTNFRNETLDWKHLCEFHQTEGIVVGEGLTFKHLLGYLKTFFSKMGFEKVRFRPGYFPYTECSVEPEVYHPTKKQWIELGGAGIFRAEVVAPLVGKEVPVLAWGLGLTRMIALYYDIQDIRDLYRNDIKKLREARVWMK